MLRRSKIYFSSRKSSF